MKIEFFGPPGCGKTYVKEKIVGISREEISQKANNRVLAKVKKLSKYSPISLYYSKKLRAMLFNEDLSAVFHDLTISDMLDSIVLVATSYKIGFSSHSILDEGLVHRIISLGVNYNLSTEKVIEIISFFQPILKNVDVIFISASINEILESIRLRNRKESKMDYFNEYKLEKFVKKYDMICHEVATYFNFREIRRQEIDDFIREKKLL